MFNSDALIRTRDDSASAESKDHAGTRVASLLLAILAFPAQALSSRKLQRVLLAIVVLNISCQIQKHFFVRQDAAALGSLGGLQISLTNIALAGLYVGWLVERVIHRGSWESERRRLGPVTISATLFVIFCAASLLVADDATLGAFEVISIVERFLLYVYIIAKVRSREDILFVVRIVLVSVIVQSIVMLAQNVGLVDAIDWYGVKARAEFAGDRRVSGTLGSPNPAAAYLAMIMAFAFAMLGSGVRGRDRGLSAAAFLLAIVPLVFTLSRGGWLSFLIGIMIVLLCSGSRRSRRLVAVSLGMVIVAVALFVGPVHERLFSDDHGSAASRMPLNRLALAMIEEHPLMGVGINNFSVGMRPYLAHNLSGEFVYTVHNSYLCVWAETGIGGLIAFVMFAAAIIYTAFRTWQLQDVMLSPMALGLAAGVTGFMVQMNFDPFRDGPAAHCLWLFGGLVTVMYRLSREAKMRALEQ